MNLYFRIARGALTYGGFVSRRFDKLSVSGVR